MNKLVKVEIFSVVVIILLVIFGLTYENVSQKINEDENIQIVAKKPFPIELRKIPNKIKTDSIFIVYTDKNNIINVFNPKTREIVFSDSDATTVIEFSMNALDPNRTQKQMVTIIGDYIISSTIDIPSNIILQLKGQLKAEKFLNTTMIQNSDDVNGNKNIEIFGGLINGNKMYQGLSGTYDELHTIRIKNVNNFYIHDTKIINGWTSAIRTSFSNIVVIENNKIDNSGDDGIAINEQTTLAIIRGNVITNSGQNGKSYGTPTGIEIQDGAHDVIVAGNIIKNPIKDGIQASTHIGKPSPYNSIIINNKINGADGNGIGFYGTPDAILLNSLAYNNTIFNVGNTGIHIEISKNILVNHNFISDSGYKGIVTYGLGGGNNTIINNYVSGSQRSGISIEATSTGDQVIENHVLNNADGIEVLGNNTDIIGNIIEDTHIDQSKRVQDRCMLIQAGSKNTFVYDNSCINNIHEIPIYVSGSAINFTEVETHFSKNIPDIKTTELLNNFTINQNELSGWIKHYGNYFNLTQVLEGTWYPPEISTKVMQE